MSLNRARVVATSPRARTLSGNPPVASSSPRLPSRASRALASSHRSRTLPPEHTARQAQRPERSLPQRLLRPAQAQVEVHRVERRRRHLERVLRIDADARARERPRAARGISTPAARPRGRTTPTARERGDEHVLARVTL